LGGHPLVAEILWARGFTTLDAARAFLDPDCYTPAPATDMPGLAQAAERLQSAIAGGERIRVWGDFDVDGQTAASLLVLGLQTLGAQVDYTIPDRASHSHGLNKPGISRAGDEGVRVLLTCDCGVTDFEEIAFARRLGLDVVVSDHHDLDPSQRLPDAAAVVNPKRLPPGHPLANLPGVGVAYKLVEGLVHPSLSGSFSSLLDLVALGIIADVAYQRDDTRYLLQRGLAQLRAAPRPGIRALLRAADIEPAFMDAEDIGFQIGPRLNAVGRLDRAELCVQLLTTEDQSHADRLAERIEGLNEQRKVLQRAVEDSAFEQIARDPSLLRQPVIVLNAPDWHPSVIGVVASTVSGRYDKPAILISARPGEIGRGSARSVNGIDIHAAIVAQGALVETSGGHPMAAGFGIRSENVPAFRAGISAYISRQPAVFSSQMEREEAVVAWRDVNLELADQIERLAPFGPGNPRPVLKSERLRIVRTEPLGNNGKHQALYLSDDEGHIAKALWWRSAQQPAPEDACNLCFTLHRRTYRGKPSVQIHVARLEDAGASNDRRAAALVGSRFGVLDLRGELDRRAALNRIIADYGAGNVQVWAELDVPGPSGQEPEGRSRLQLAPAPVLVVWSAPPGPDELADALERAKPQTVVLLAAPVAPDQDQPDPFLRQLIGMLKVAERRGESVDDPTIVARMAARVGQREATIRAGIQARDSSAHRDRLAYLLDETRAYRRYFQTAAADEVMRVRARD